MDALLSSIYQGLLGSESPQQINHHCSHFRLELHIFGNLNMLFSVNSSWGSAHVQELSTSGSASYLSNACYLMNVMLSMTFHIIQANTKRLVSLVVAITMFMITMLMTITTMTTTVLVMMNNLLMLLLTLYIELKPMLKLAITNQYGHRNSFLP